MGRHVRLFARMGVRHLLVVGSGSGLGGGGGDGKGEVD